MRKGEKNEVNFEKSFFLRLSRPFLKVCDEISKSNLFLNQNSQRNFLRVTLLRLILSKQNVNKLAKIGDLNLGLWKSLIQIFPMEKVDYQAMS